MSAHGSFSGVEALVEPYNRTHDRYQRYYRHSLAAYCSSQGIPFRETGARFRGVLRLLHRTRASARFQRLLPPPAGPRLVDLAARLLGAGKAPEHAFGRYLIHSHGATAKVCIDAFDSGEIQSPDLLEWSDVYFKTNYWPALTYPSKVLPLANLNPEVLPRMQYLKESRNLEKEWDLLAFFRVWGGADELEGVEHNLRLFEVLARLECKKKLLAYLISGDIAASAARLERAGVPWTTHWMPLAELWHLTARSRLNVVRHGMHQCMPWRLTETLAMAGCPVLDYPAQTRWHVPLEEGVHYLSLNIPYRPPGGGGLNPDEVIERVHSWFADGEQIASVARNAGRYFDEHLVPERLGRYIHETALRRF